MNQNTTTNWDLIIRPTSGWLDLHLSDLWRYRDLTMLFVWRDFVAQYKQTILGPLWYLIQPLFSTIVFTIVFGRVAKIPTDGLPPVSLLYGWGHLLVIFRRVPDAHFGHIYYQCGLVWESLFPPPDRAPFNSDIEYPEVWHTISFLHWISGLFHDKRRAHQTELLDLSHALSFIVDGGTGSWGRNHHICAHNKI